MAVDTLVLRAHDEVAPQADAAFAAFVAAWACRLPPSADIVHIGSTAIPGCLTKGDLDVCVRVNREDVARVDALLATGYARNTGSFRSAEFSAFKDDSHHPPLGVQLVARGSELDVFVGFRDCLLWATDGCLSTGESRLYCARLVGLTEHAVSDWVALRNHARTRSLPGLASDRRSRVWKLVRISPQALKFLRPSSFAYTGGLRRGGLRPCRLACSSVFQPRRVPTHPLRWVVPHPRKGDISR